MLSLYSESSSIVTRSKRRKIEVRKPVKATLNFLKFFSNVSFFLSVLHCGLSLNDLIHLLHSLPFISTTLLAILSENKNPLNRNKYSILTLSNIRNLFTIPIVKEFSPKHRFDRVIFTTATNSSLKIEVIFAPYSTIIENKEFDEDISSLTCHNYAVTINEILMFLENIQYKYEKQIKLHLPWKNNEITTSLINSTYFNGLNLAFSYILSTLKWYELTWKYKNGDSDLVNSIIRKLGSFECYENDQLHQVSQFMNFTMFLIDSPVLKTLIDREEFKNWPANPWSRILCGLIGDGKYDLFKKFFDTRGDRSIDFQKLSISLNVPELHVYVLDRIFYFLFNNNHFKQIYRCIKYLISQLDNDNRKQNLIILLMQEALKTYFKIDWLTQLDALSPLEINYATVIYYSYPTNFSKTDWIRRVKIWPWLLEKLQSFETFCKKYIISAVKDRKENIIANILALFSYNHPRLNTHFDELDYWPYLFTICSNVESFDIVLLETEFSKLRSNGWKISDNKQCFFNLNLTHEELQKQKEIKKLNEMSSLQEEHKESDEQN